MNYDPQTRHIELMRHAPRAMAYQPGQDFAEWQSAARARLTQLLGLPLEMPADDCFNIEWERDEADFHEIRFTYCSEPGVDVCCNMLCPHGASGKLPMIICLQGHSKGMHISLGRPKYPGNAAPLWHHAQLPRLPADGPRHRPGPGRRIPPAQRHRRDL